MTINLDQLLKKVRNLTASDFTRREIRPISEETPLLEIINELGTSDLPIIPVIDKESKYIGIITLRDLLFIFQRKHTSLHEAFHLQHMTDGYVAGELININLPIIYDDDSLERITDIMARYQSTVLPRAPNRKEQINGLIYFKDIITEIRTILRKMVSDNQKAENQEDKC